MSTVRPTLSKKNPYHISKHRYYELKHFCLQYPEWRKELLDTAPYLSSPKISQEGKTGQVSDPTGEAAVRRQVLLGRMKLVEQAALGADADLFPYILKAVTEDLSFTVLEMAYKIPCGKDMYYDRYRKFFWLLSKER